MRQSAAFPRRIIALVLSGLLFGSARGQEDFSLLEAESIRAAVGRVASSVVRLETFGGLERVDGRVVGVGPTTGLVVSEEGHIISSAFNFIQKPTSILVTLADGRRGAAEIIARDQSRMLVLLKANFDEPLTPATAAPTESMRVGQWTIAVGRTLSLEEPNVSVGVMSALDRVWGKAIQTDAKISPSNYGGPLVDIQGRVLGVLVPLSPQAQQEVAGAEWYDSGIGFAVPLVDVLARLESLKAGEDQHPGLLGISLVGTNEIVDEPVIAAVRVKSPGEIAGAKPGDKIVSAAGLPVSRVSQLKHVLGPMYAGEQFAFQVERAGERLDLKATLVAELLPYEHPFFGILPERGLALAEPRNDQPENQQEEAASSGVVIRYVYPSSPADQAGVIPGDRLTRWNGERTDGQEEVERLLAQQEPGDRVTVGWQRGDEVFEREVTLGSLPREIPDTLPEVASRDVPWPWEGDRPAVGKISLKIPEEPNECFAWIPENYRPNQATGVLVWLHPAGEYDFDGLLETWKEICERESLVLLAPKSAHATGWQPTELGYLRRVMEQLFDQYVVDRRRVVLHGSGVGGAMGYLTAFSHRELIRGVALVDAAVPARLRIPDNDPLQRLAIFSAVPENSRSLPAVEAGLEGLRQRKFPVTAIRQSEEAKGLSLAERAKLIRWLDTLDRL